MKKNRSLQFFVTNDISYDQRMQRICSALADAGYHVILVGRKRRNSIPVEGLPVSTKRLNCWFSGGIAFYFEINLRIFFYILSNRADLNCAIDLDTLGGVAFASRIRRIPYVFDAHEWFTEVPELRGKKIKKSVWGFVERTFAPGAQIRYTVNQSLADIFKERLGLDFEVIRNVPVEHHPDPSGYRPAKPVILYQGALNAGRGLEATLIAMKKLDNAVLWLVGEGDLSDDLRKSVAQLCIQDRVEFLGYRKPEELKRITSQATIGLNLLESESLNYYYSLANKFFDYMHADVPSLNMRFPEYEKILEQIPCGAMIERCDAELIAEAISTMLFNTAAYQKMQSACEKGRALFNWSAEQDSLVKLYDELLLKETDTGDN